MSEQNIPLAGNFPDANGASADGRDDTPWQRTWDRVRVAFRRFAPGGVSRIHLYEANERFYGLRRDVEYQCVLANASAAWEPGPTLFGFGFLAGFSERLVFPELR